MRFHSKERFDRSGSNRKYKVYLDGYGHLDLITGKGPSKRNESFYFAESTLGAVRRAVQRSLQKRIE